MVLWRLLHAAQEVKADLRATVTEEERVYRGATLPSQLVELERVARGLDARKAAHYGLVACLRWPYRLWSLWNILHWSPRSLEQAPHAQTALRQSPADLAAVTATQEATQPDVPDR